MNTFFTSDTHFYHENIIKYCDRPFNSVYEMNEFIIEKWNKIVKVGDTVYHLGDFAFCRPNQLIELLNRLNGNIRLVYGNHDKEIKNKKGLQSHFEWCKMYHTINGAIPIILFHYPMLSWDRQAHNSIHLFGHVHNTPFNVDLPKNMFNVGVDVNGFAPVHIDSIIQSRVV